MSTPGGDGGRGLRADHSRTQQLAAFAIGEAPVQTGDVIAGRYRVEEVIGVGGMGVVVSAVHLLLDQRVAIKLILPYAMANEGLRERFLREARAAAQLRSAHVTRVLDVGNLPSGAPFMVMELLEGCDLAALLAKSGPLSPESAAGVVAQACEAVAEAHARGIVHRDIKPQNLFLTRTVGGNALVKVLDFGISKITVAGGENLTSSMTMMGSPAYMSPEQMRSSRDVDARTDIWALGVVLFELLTGRPPFQGHSVPEICLKVVEGAPISLAHDQPDLPPGLGSIVMRCLEKHPANRFRDVGELAAALAAFAPPASSALVARTGATVSGLRRPGGAVSDAPLVAEVEDRRRRTRGTFVTTLVTVLLACAVIVGGAAWSRFPRERGAEARVSGSAPVTASPAPVPQGASAPAVLPSAASPAPASEVDASLPETSAIPSPQTTPRPPKPLIRRPRPMPTADEEGIPFLR